MVQQFMSNISTDIDEKCEVVDFDIHGLVGIRLLNPSRSDVNTIKRQLGPLTNGSLNREPDIIVRFKKNLPLRKLTYLGLDEVGYTPDGFFVLKSKKVGAKVRIPFESIGDRCEIECETGLRDIPHLITILNLTLCTKDCIPLHASAFIYKDKGILVTGWSKGGKTEALLGFVNQGAKYVGDEWVILAKDGRSMYGIPEPITLWDWQIKQLPFIYPLLNFSDRLIFRVIHFIGNMHSYLGSGKFKNTFPVKILTKAMPTLRQQLHVNFPPEKILESSCIQLNAEPNIIFFIMSHSDPSIYVEPWNSEDIARRMLHSVRYEQLRFFRHYQAFKFAFPDLQNHFLERVHDIQKTLLLHALNSKEAYRVLHPYPVSLESLYHHMKPFCEGH
jgi:hypothetical protein